MIPQSLPAEYGRQAHSAIDNPQFLL